MPKHDDPPGAGAAASAGAASLTRLEKLFDARLYGAAERLVDSGCVADVRILQGGRVMTGITHAGARADEHTGKHRVYIQYRGVQGSSDSPMLEGECSCGASSTCVHVVAVSIAAAKSLRKPSDIHRGDSHPATAPAPAFSTLPAAIVAAPVQSPPSARGLAHSVPAQQQLSYLLDGSGAGKPAFHVGELQLSVWVTQASGDRYPAAQPCVFALRNLEGRDEYPRYVDAQDREILRTLTGLRRDGPWELRGAAGSALLRQTVATGRALWGSLAGPKLSAGTVRRAIFTWEVLPTGDQRLCCEALGSLVPLLDLEPALYVDTTNNECGLLELSGFPGLLRQYWNQPPIAPEDVVTVGESIARHPQGAAFPKPRAMRVQRKAARVRGKLRLSTEGDAKRQFVYDGIVVDDCSTPDDCSTCDDCSIPDDGSTPDDGSIVDDCSTPAGRSVRHWDGEALIEVERDAHAEQALRAQFESILPEPPRSRDAWLAFMMSTVPALQTLGWEIDVDPGFPYRIASADGWYADLKTNRTEWYDLQLGVTVDGQPVNLLPALVEYLQAEAETSGAFGAPVAAGASVATDAPVAAPGGPATGPGLPTDTGLPTGACQSAGEHLFVPLTDGRYLPVAMERIRRIANTLVELFDRESLNNEHSLTLPVSQASRLAQLMFEPGAPTWGAATSGVPTWGTPAWGTPTGAAPALRSNDPSLLSLIESLKDFSGIPRLDAPAHFPATLRPYQEEGLGWLQFLRRHRLGGILADDMGLGKTVQTLAHLAIEKAQGRMRNPSLIVAPVSVLGNWQREIRRFTPELGLVTWHGAGRKASLAGLATADIILTGYPLLQIDGEILLAREFYFLILDEAQVIKNPRAKVSQAARALTAEHRLCLTGTPMENHLGELWSLFDFAQPGLLGDERQFQRHYRTPIEKGGNAARARALSRRIGPFLLRRTKDAVAQELPPKMQILESIVLDERQRDFYDGIRLAMHRRVREAIQRQGVARSHIAMLDALLKLRQACCDPRLVSADALTQGIPSAKLEWLTTALPEMIAEGRRILLFSQFTSMLRLIERVVTECSIPYCLLTGETRDRTALVDRFQSGVVPLFLISLKAGGTGLNLTAADTVIHYDPWWNPAAEAQATDRAHRIGQDKPVFVYKLIAQGTVEEKILQLQTEKHALVSGLYTDKNAAPASLSAADFEALFES